MIGDTTVTRTGHVVGALAYMSPEQAAGEVASPASDVYSLGTVLLFAYTGDHPFRAERAEIPSKLRKIITHCRCNDPTTRPTPAQLLTMIGDLAVTARTWPLGVDHLIAKQRAAVARLLSDGRTTRLDTRPLRTRVERKSEPTPPPPPRSKQAIPTQAKKEPEPKPPPPIAKPPSPPPTPEWVKTVGVLALIALIVWAVVVANRDADADGSTDAQVTPTYSFSPQPYEPDRPRLQTRPTSRNRSRRRAPSTRKASMTPTPTRPRSPPTPCSRTRSSTTRTCTTGMWPEGDGPAACTHRPRCKGF